MFFTGLILGVAVSAIVALAVLLIMMMKGGTAWANNGGGAQVVQNYPTGGEVPTQPAFQAQPVKAVDEKVDHIRGGKNAKVTLIEYSDFECPFCQRHAPTLDQALKEFPKDVRVVYRHYPLSFHPNAQPSAEASECVAKLNGEEAFWKFHDRLFVISPALDRASLVAAAKEIGVNEGNFTKCLDSHEMANRVNSDAAGGNDSGVEGTPATFVNGQLVSGAVPYEQLKAAIVAAGGKE
jgi:protein-disulfide isomerase